MVRDGTGAADRRVLRPGPAVAVAAGGRPRQHDARPGRAAPTPERVYQRALQYFTPDEIAEAFAATRGVASPSQLRLMIKQDPRDLLAQFRRLAPQRRPIPIQRWSVRRVALALGVLVAALLVAGFTYGLLTPFRGVDVPDPPSCNPDVDHRAGGPGRPRGHRAALRRRSAVRVELRGRHRAERQGQLHPERRHGRRPGRDGDAGPDLRPGGRPGRGQPPAGGSSGSTPDHAASTASPAAASRTSSSGQRATTGSCRRSPTGRSTSCRGTGSSRTSGSRPG